MMAGVGRRWMLAGWLLLAALSGTLEETATAQVATTTVQDTVYGATGTPASGTVVVSWAGFTTAGGSAVPAGSTAVTLGAGGALSVPLVPNAGATPVGSYYTAVYHLSDGTTSREFWVVPAAPGRAAVTLAAIRTPVLPTSVAMQTASRQYVDAAIAKAVGGYAADDAGEPFLLKSGGTVTGPLTVAGAASLGGALSVNGPATFAGPLAVAGPVTFAAPLALPGDPVSALQAADTSYVDASLAAAAAAAIAPARLPVLGASGPGHAPGAAPDPGATAGTARYLREDGQWVAPPAGGNGSSGTSGGGAGGAAGGDLGGNYPNPAVTAVHATGGTLDGVVVGGTTPAPGSFSMVNVTALGTGAGNGLAALFDPVIGTGQNAYVAVGKAFSSGNAGFLVWQNGDNEGSANTTGFLILDTYGSANPVQVGGSRVNTKGSLMVNNGSAVNVLGGTCASGIALCVNAGSTFTVDAAGHAAAAAFHEALSTPASSAAGCSPGDFTDDTDFHYVCVAAAHWRRVALADF